MHGSYHSGSWLGGRYNARGVAAGERYQVRSRGDGPGGEPGGGRVSAPGEQAGRAELAGLLEVAASVPPESVRALAGQVRQAADVAWPEAEAEPEPGS